MTPQQDFQSYILILLHEMRREQMIRDLYKAEAKQ